MVVRDTQRSFFAEQASLCRFVFVVFLVFVKRINTQQATRSRPTVPSTVQLTVARGGGWLLCPFAARFVSAAAAAAGYYGRLGSLHDVEAYSRLRLKSGLQGRQLGRELEFICAQLSQFCD